MIFFSHKPIDQIPQQNGQKPDEIGPFVIRFAEHISLMKNIPVIMKNHEVTDHDIKRIRGLLPGTNKTNVTNFSCSSRDHNVYTIQFQDGKICTLHDKKVNITKVYASQFHQKQNSV